MLDAVQGFAALRGTFEASTNNVPWAWVVVRSAVPICVTDQNFLVGCIWSALPLEARVPLCVTIGQQLTVNRKPFVPGPVWGWRCGVGVGDAGARQGPGTRWCVWCVQHDAVCGVVVG